MVSILTGCGAGEFEGEWCLDQVGTAAECERPGDTFYTRLSDDGSRVTGIMCEDGYSDAASGDECLNIDDTKDGETFSIDPFTPDGRKVTFEVDGDMLIGNVASTPCDNEPCTSDDPIVLHRIQ